MTTTPTSTFDQLKNLDLTGLPERVVEMLMQAAIEFDDATERIARNIIEIQRAADYLDDAHVHNRCLNPGTLMAETQHLKDRIAERDAVIERIRTLAVVAEQVCDQKGLRYAIIGALSTWS